MLTYYYICSSLFLFLVLLVRVLLLLLPGNVLIHSSNPTTNTIQGPNIVLYGEALYYNCYNKDAVCRFNLTTKTVTELKLPEGTRFATQRNL